MNLHSAARPEQTRHQRGQDLGGHGQGPRAATVMDLRPEMNQQQSLLELLSDSPRVQRSCACPSSACGGGEGDDPSHGQNLQRAPAPGAAAGWSEAVVPRSVHDVLLTRGSLLDVSIRTFFEAGYGHDFGDVQVHTDAQAAASAHDVKSLAYTVGNHIVFASGRFNPSTPAGRTLLAHELAHTIQQRGASTSIQRLRLGGREDAMEQEADRAAAQVLRGGKASVQLRASDSRLQGFWITREAAGGCGICYDEAFPGKGPQNAGRVAHTVVQEAFKSATSGIGKDRYVEFPLSAPGDENGRLDLVQKTSTGYAIGEIKPATPKGEETGMKDLDWYKDKVQATYPQSTVEPLVTTIPVGKGLMMPDALATAAGCVTQRLGMVMMRPGIYGYFCAPPYSQVRSTCACRPPGPVPEPVPVPAAKHSWKDAADELLSRAQVFYAEIKEAAYKRLVDAAIASRRTLIAALRTQAMRLPPNLRNHGLGIVDVADGVLQIGVNFIFYVIGVIVGLGESSVDLVTGVLQIIYELLKTLWHLIVAVFSKPGLLENDLRALKSFLDNFVPGLKKLFDDWTTKLSNAPQERQSAMIGELVGEIVTFIMAWEVTSAKLSKLPKVTISLPVLEPPVALAGGGYLGGASAVPVSVDLAKLGTQAGAAGITTLQAVVLGNKGQQQTTGSGGSGAIGRSRATISTTETTLPGSKVMIKSEGRVGDAPTLRPGLEKKYPRGSQVGLPDHVRFHVEGIKAIGEELNVVYAPTRFNISETALIENQIRMWYAEVKATGGDLYYEFSTKCHIHSEYGGVRIKVLEEITWKLERRIPGGDAMEVLFEHTGRP